VTIGGKPATIFFAGLAPGFVGLLQVNARIDASVRPGRAEVTLQVGDQSSEVAGTAWVK
jgi:uncharacterized protein (TIGR03437 family)